MRERQRNKENMSNKSEELFSFEEKLSSINDSDYNSSGCDINE